MFRQILAFERTRFDLLRPLVRATLGLLSASALGACQAGPRVVVTSPTVTQEDGKPVGPPTPSPWQQVRQIRIIDTDNLPIRAMAIDTEGRHLATGSTRSGRLWHLPGGEEVITIPRSNAFDALDFSPDGQTIASADYTGRVTLFEMDRGQPLFTIKAHERLIFNVLFSPDGKYLATNSYEPDARLWDVETQELAQTFIHPSPEATIGIAFDSTGRYLAGGGFDGGMWLWEVETGKLVRGYAGHRGPVQVLAIDPKSELLVSGSFDATIKIWELQTGRLLETLKGHAEIVSDLAISSDGSLLASSSRDKTVRIWDLQSYQEIAVLEGDEPFRRIEFAPDSMLLVAAAEDGQLWFWEPASEP